MSLSIAQSALKKYGALAQLHTLSFYDASWAATAVELRIPLISADRTPLTAGLAESVTEIITRLQLPMN